MYYWFEEHEEPYRSDANKLANWHWEEVEGQDDRDELDDDFDEDNWFD